MTAIELKDLLDRVQSWPESAQAELISIAKQIESELQASDYVASRDELRVIDAAIASVDAGKTTTDDEVAATFAKFRRE